MQEITGKLKKTKQKESRKRHFKERKEGVHTFKQASNDSFL